MVFAGTALLLSGCTTLSLRPFDPNAHSTVYQEWPPHRNAGEWWYVTGYLHLETSASADSARLLMYQFTIFHQAKGLASGYLIDLALSDYTTGQHIFEEHASTDPNEAYARGNDIVFGKSSISLAAEHVSITAVGSNLSFTLNLTAVQPPVWQGDNGVEAMGVSDAADQMSYYYSFPRLKTSGTISYRAYSGRRISGNVVGESWLDRQWGHFSESGWDWFSIRLFDGTDIMLYAFPATGFIQGTLSAPDGTVRRLYKASYNTVKWQVHEKSRFGLEWRVAVPGVENGLRLVALSPNDFNDNRVIHYWEGLCDVFDDSGQLLGYAVEETTASAHPVDITAR